MFAKGRSVVTEYRRDDQRGYTRFWQSSAVGSPEDNRTAFQEDRFRMGRQRTKQVMCRRALQDF